MSRKKSSLDRLIENLKPGITYSPLGIKMFCKEINVSSRGIFKRLDQDKSVKKIRISGSKEIWYSIPQSTSIEDHENETVKKLSKTILKIILSENKRHISKWIDQEFEKKLNVAVEKFVQDEFRNEILPVLIQKINDRVTQLTVTKGQIRECVIEVLLSLADSLKQGE